MILFVCTGNICRSAMGEILFRHYAQLAEVEIETASGGVLAWDGAPITKDALKVLAEAGVSTVSHSSQVLSTDLVRQAHLVIVMTRDHASGVLAKDKTARDYTFLAGEFLRLMKEYPLLKEVPAPTFKKEAFKAGAFKKWVERLNQIRDESGAISSKAKGTVMGLARDEVSDPAIGDLEEHREVFRVMNALTQLLVENLAGLSN